MRPDYHGTIIYSYSFQQHGKRCTAVCGVAGTATKNEALPWAIRYSCSRLNFECRYIWNNENIRGKNQFLPARQWPQLYGVSAAHMNIQFEFRFWSCDFQSMNLLKLHSLKLRETILSRRKNRSENYTRPVHAKWLTAVFISSFLPFFLFSAFTRLNVNEMISIAVARQTKSVRNLKYILW